MIKFIVIGIIIFLAFNIGPLIGWIATAFSLAFIIFWNIPIIYAKRGNAAYNEGNHLKALSLYEKAYKTGRASADITLTYGILLLRNAKPQDAVTIFNLIVMNPSYKKEIKNDAKQYRALAYFKLNNIQDAIEEAEEIFEDCKNTLSYGLLCYLKLATNAPIDDVYALCKEAYEYNSDDRDICDNMTVAHIRKGEYNEAKEIVDNITKKFPAFIEGYYHAAVVYYKLGDKEKAQELLNEKKKKCSRTYLTTISEEEISRFKSELNGENTDD